MVHATLVQILNREVEEGAIRQNPASRVHTAKRPKPAERMSLTPQQALQLAQDLRDAAIDGRIVAVWIALATGARRGEILALTWGDIDLQNGRLRIRRQIDSQGQIRAPKSQKSVRNLSLDAGTVSYLERWREIQSREFHSGEAVPEAAPVCSNLAGGFLDPNVFSRWRREFFADHGLGHFEKEERYVDRKGITRIRRTGYKGFNLHELRHTQATLLIGSGTDLKTVQNRLGHSSAQLTMNIYAHALEQNDRDAADAIGSLLSPPAESL